MFQEEQNKTVPRADSDPQSVISGVVGYDNFTADPYPASLNFSLPVGQEWAEAIMERHPYVYDPSLLRPDCDDRWFEVERGTTSDGNKVKNIACPPGRQV